LRWMTHHSKLKGEFGDGIIIGASSPEQLEQNLKALEDQRSLPTDIIAALDAGWERVKAISGRYWH
jgi:aflatoxin B1 aldehyde reductase